MDGRNAVRHRSAHPPGTVALRAGLLLELDRHAHRTDNITEPVTTIRTINAFLAAMRDELARFSTIRLRALAELRAQGSSYDSIARSTGLSKARVAQLATAGNHQTASATGRT